MKKYLALIIMFFNLSEAFSTMKILCITHADFETPGVIQNWAQKKNYEFTICKPYKGDTCLAYNNFDFLIIMGGPQSACELEKDPYLFDEVKLIQYAIENNKIVLGFCLGAQLIGQALGAPAARSPEKEIGVFPIALNKDGQLDSLLKDFPPTFNVIHWHNDMPGLTKTSQILAASKGCPRQIIKYGPKVYGFQCHLEITKDGIETMIENCPNDFAPSIYTQSPEDLRLQNYNSINDRMIVILEQLISS